MFAATVICLASLSQFPDDRPAVFRGVVVERGTDRPLAGVTVRLDGSWGQDDDGAEIPPASTDARGRFDGLATPKRSSWRPSDGQHGPRMRIRAEDDRVWPWTAAGADGKPRKLSDRQRGEVVEAVYEREAESRWQGNGAGATLIVECPPTGAVEVVVRGPDGRPLADAPIVVAPLMAFPRDRLGPIRFAGRTDGAGTFRLHSFEGPREFDVTAVGEGFGSTGRVEVAVGRTVRPEMPPLARYARIEGRLDDALRGPGAEVFVQDDSPYDHGPAASAACDAEGRFTLTDVPPGDYRGIGLSRDGKSVPHVSREFRLGPGQVFKDVVLSPPAPAPGDGKEPRRVVPSPRGDDGDEKRTVAWVEGTVSDPEGRPIADAAVYVRVDFDGGVRARSDIKKTTTDPRGRYRVEGPWHPSMGVFSVVVAARGRPPIVAYAPGLESTVEPSELKPSRLDVAMGAAGGGGSLSVAVVRDGRGLPGADVYLTTAAADRLFDETAKPIAWDLDAELRKIAVPRAVAAADGVARFDDLPPDVYKVVATPPADPNRAAADVWPWGRRAEGVALGVGVAPGGRVATTVAIRSASVPTRFRLLGPDGAAVANRTVSLAVGRGGATSSSSDFKTDERGEGERGFDAGLWTLDFRYRDSEARSFPIREEPFYRIEATIPVAPALAAAGAIELRAVRREPGSIKVRLLDRDGAPARGGVMILPGFLTPTRRAGSVDDRGWVRFVGMHSGKYALRGSIDGAASAPRPHSGPRPLADDELTDRAMIRDREVMVESDGETAVELRPEPVGYVRATVHAPEGRGPMEYIVGLHDENLPGEHTPWERSADGAEWLFGPVQPGRWPIAVVETTRDLGRRAYLEREVVVEPGRVAHVDLDAPPSPEPPAAVGSGRPMARLGMGGVSVFATGPDGATMTVVTADGRTPAFGARALFIPAGGDEPVALGTADAAGRLSWSGFWRRARGEGEQGPEPVKEPTVLAWGADGAGPVVATLKPGEPPRLILPTPNAATGRVTIAGAAVAGLDARVRVVLVAEGRGAVDAAMARETLADPDGRFRFAGLAPGGYVAQAVRDEIWTSKPVPLTVEAGKDAAVDLDVPEPGATIALELVDREGGPVAAGFSIKRPAGPLGGLTAIAGRTDAGGAAVVRGLAAGGHDLVVDGSERPIALDVPPARPGAAPSGVRVEVDRRVR